MKKATVAQAKRLHATRGGWGSFKHNLMDFLGIPQTMFDSWDVPEEWIAAFRKANGRPMHNRKN